jgi:hypothetical protein
VGEHEETARRIVEAVMRVPVVQHDHNVGRSIPDLRINYPDRPPAFVEVVADESENWRGLHEALNRGNKVLAVPGLRHNWWIWPHADARVKELEARLPELLRQLDEAGETFGQWVDTSLDARIQSSPFYESIRKLRLHRLIAGPEADGAAIVRFVPPGAEGPSEVDFTRVGAWCGEFLSAPRRADVRRKLVETGASERHAFVVVTISSEWSVWHALSEDSYPHLPPNPPQLPEEITHVWLMGDFRSRCIAWLPDKGGWIDYADTVWPNPVRRRRAMGFD